ncbi:MAG: ribonuclease Z [Candidatus Norongarragalinales archaeon]
MIRLVVLGSAAALPSPRHLPSSIAVKYGDVFLFDCCEAAQRQMMKFGVSYAKLRAVFLSHLHADHWIGLIGLSQTLGFFERKEPLMVFGPKGTRRLLEAVFSQRELAPSFPIEVKDVEEGVVFEDKLFTVAAFPVEHETRALGYSLEEREKTKFDEAKARSRGIHGRLFSEIMEKGELMINGKKVKLKDVTFKQAGKKIVFSGDTKPCASVVRAAKNADLLIHDACFSDDEKEKAAEKAHSTARQAAEIAKKAKAKKLLLTHFSNRYDENRLKLVEEAKSVFPESIEAKEGLEILV